jgi:hypothetical protein
MNTIIDKRDYSQPEITRVKLDNEISLALESNPAAGPDEVRNNKAPEHFNIDPFKAKQG